MYTEKDYVYFSVTKRRWKSYALEARLVLELPIPLIVPFKICFEFLHIASIKYLVVYVH